MNGLYTKHQSVTVSIGGEYIFVSLIVGVITLLMLAVGLTYYRNKKRTPYLNASRQNLTDMDTLAEATEERANEDLLDKVGYNKATSSAHIWTKEKSPKAGRSQDLMDEEDSPNAGNSKEVIIQGRGAIARWIKRSQTKSDAATSERIWALEAAARAGWTVDDWNKTDSDH